MSDGFSWFQPPGRTPTLDDLDHRPFLKRHFWPPSAFGIIVLSVIVSMLVGFTGALIYTSSDNSHIAAIDPADQTRIPPTVPPSAEPKSPGTTQVPEILDAEGIAKKAGPSVWSVSSLDEAGRPVEGSGFVAGSFGGQTYVLTSLSIVRAATRIPGPDIVVRNAGSDVRATLWTWEEEHDMALLVTGRTAPSLSWADDTPAPKTGDKVFVLSGAGGGAMTGVIQSISPSGIRHSIPVDERRQGAPLLNERAQVLGMVSLGVTPAAPAGDPFTAIPIAAACERVLSCGSGTAGAPTTTVAPTGNNATPTTRR